MERRRGHLRRVAQQAERVRRIGMLTRVAADDPDGQARIAAFVQAMQQSGLDRRPQPADRISPGWAIPTAFANTRWNWSRSRRTSSWSLAPRRWSRLLQATRTVPIVFVSVADPVGAGFVDSLARPGGNATGFLQFEYSLAGKWLEMLKQIAPGVTRVAVLRDPAIPPGSAQFAAIQSVAPSVGVEVSPINLRDAGEIERAVAALRARRNGGLIVTASGLSVVHRELIITLAARHKLPTVYLSRTSSPMAA